MSEDPFVLSADVEGRLHLGRVDAVCDFCLAPDPAWEFPAGPVQVAGHHAITDSIDGWAACDHCHELIEADRIAELVFEAPRRQREHVPAGTVMPDGVVQYPPLDVGRALMLVNIARFINARRGPARRLEP